MRRRLNLWDFEAIDWDDEQDQRGNLAHCLAHGVDERVVDQVLRGWPVEIVMEVKTAEIAIIGPDLGGARLDAAVRLVVEAGRLAPPGHRVASRAGGDRGVEAR